MSKPLLVLTLVALLAGAALAKERTWTSSDGREMTAEFVSLANGEVTFRKDGKLVTVPLSRLSEMDQKVVLDLAAGKPVADEPAGTGEVPDPFGNSNPSSRPTPPTTSAPVPDLARPADRITIQNRTWTYDLNKQTTAKFVRVNGSDVVLNRAGKVLTIPFFSLSEADQQYVRDVLKQQGKERLIPTEPPKTASTNDGTAPTAGGGTPPGASGLPGPGARGPGGIGPSGPGFGPGGFGPGMPPGIGAGPGGIGPRGPGGIGPGGIGSGGIGPGGVAPGAPPGGLGPGAPGGVGPTGFGPGGPIPGGAPPGIGSGGIPGADPGSLPPGSDPVAGIGPGSGIGSGPSFGPSPGVPGSSPGMPGMPSDRAGSGGFRGMSDIASGPRIPREPRLPDLPISSSSPFSQSTRQVYQCSGCKREISEFQAAGSKCPYCGTYWTYKENAGGSRQYTGVNPGLARTGVGFVAAIVVVVVLGVMGGVVGVIIAVVKAATRPARRPTYRQW